jgi:hypothetical protein
LTAKTSYHRRRIELIVGRLKVGLEVRLEVGFEAKLEAKSSIEVAAKVGRMHSYSKVVARVAARIKVAGELNMQDLEVLDL